MKMNCTDSKLEKELSEIGSQIGKFLDRQGSRVSKNLDHLKKHFDDAMEKVADVIDSELALNNQANRAKLNKLKFGSKVKWKDFRGFYIGDHTIGFGFGIGGHYTLVVERNGIVKVVTVTLDEIEIDED